MTHKEVVEKIDTKKLTNSFKYAFHGIIETMKREQNMVIHIIITILVIFMGLFFRISRFEWLTLIFTIAAVISVEVINTSIEALTDLVSPKQNELARIAKDCSAGAVLVFAIASVIIGLVIFIPYLIDFM